MNQVRNPTLSLCMIVKDEERFLPGCLDSVKDYVDEIIIVDTGSADSTVEIAKRFKAIVYHHAWENSFSKARNYSLKYATCDWILILDADEEVDKEDVRKLRNVIKGDGVNVFCLPVYGKSAKGENVSIGYSERVFKNHLDFYYEGIVHNSLKYSGQTKKLNLKIYHYGYSLDEEQMERKYMRTSALLREQIKNSPEDPLPHHYLAISCLDRKRVDECILEVLEAIRLFEKQKSSAEIRFLSYYTASVAFYQKKDLANAEIYALNALGLHPDYVDAYCILTSIYFLRNEHDKCIEATMKYLCLLKSIESDPTTASFVPYHTLNNASLAYTRLAIVYLEQGKRGDGVHALNNAVNCTDNVCAPYLMIGEYFMGQKDYDLAEEIFNDGLKRNPGSKEMMNNIAILKRMKVTGGVQLK